jgi:DNA-binding MarR family transcriptional regulator
MSADLCGPLNLDKSSISRVVKKLVEAGEIEEEFDGGAAGKGDGRVKRLVLTAKGKETVKGIDVSGFLLIRAPLFRIAFLSISISHIMSMSHIRAGLLGVTMSILDLPLTPSSMYYQARNLKFSTTS